MSYPKRKFASFSPKRKAEWINANSDEITIGIITVSAADLEKYYGNVHTFETYYYNESRGLCKIGVDAVLKMPVYRRQSDVDKVFFDAAANECQKFLLDFVESWRHVYQQLAASKVPFRDIITGNRRVLKNVRDYRMAYIETVNIRKFFRILNMQRAVEMIREFSDVILRHIDREVNALPTVYPFALKGKPIELPAAGNPLALLPANRKQLSVARA